jgi:hypothetical protein
LNAAAGPDTPGVGLFAKSKIETWAAPIDACGAKVE